MTTSEGRIARVEGILEQINERLGNIERLLEQKADRNEVNARLDRIEDRLERKADKGEMRLLFLTTITLLVAILGIVGSLFTRI
jgi:C4-type Zn-finger protein